MDWRRISSERELTGLMSLFSEARKSCLLTISFSAVSMFTSTVWVAYNNNNKHNHTHTHTIQVERQKIMRYSRSGMNSMPLANEIHYTKYGTFRLHDSLETVRSLRAERSEREEEGGKSKCSEEGRETSQPSDVRKAPRRPFIITL